MDELAEKISTWIDLIQQALELTPQAVITYASLTQIMPDKFHGFMGFVTNTVVAPQAGSGNNALAVTISSADKSTIILNPELFKSTVTGYKGSLTYYWDYGDGYSDSGPNVTHAYKAVGVYTITLVVIDAAGNTGTGNLTFSVGLPIV